VKDRLPTHAWVPLCAAASALAACLLAGLPPTGVAQEKQPDEKAELAEFLDDAK
jgi:hypothetical protein